MFKRGAWTADVAHGAALNGEELPRLECPATGQDAPGDAGELVRSSRKARI